MAPNNPLTRNDLVGWLESGCKPRARWRVGTEHEKFGFRLDDLRPLAYEGPSGIRAILRSLVDLGWTPQHEGEHLIALTRGGEGVTLEPGGQVELAGAPLQTVHQTCKEVAAHLRQIRDVASGLGVGFVGLGFQPKWGLDDIPVMPKARYALMRRYMPTRGALGLDMMFRTATVQANLDFGSEADMVRKLRVSLALQPIATALFANSPFRDGAPTGLLSLRSQVWTDTDPDRTGILPWAWEDGMGFERYVDYALDVPMYFVRRDHRYVDALGQSFRDFLAGRLPALPGETPTMQDWDDHLTTLFPEVRCKRFLEVRGADGGPWSRLCALPALWLGLLYSDSALDAAWDLVKGWTPEERLEMRDAVPATALSTPFRPATPTRAARSVGDLALQVLDIAEAGLRARGRLDGRDRDETHFLDPLKEIAESGVTPAEDLLANFEGPWRGSVDPLFRELAY